MNEDRQLHIILGRDDGADHHDVLEGTGFGDNDGRVSDPRQLLWFSPPRSFAAWTVVRS
jgi:hypothetical protein